MDIEYTGLLAALVVEPLSKVIGKPLQSVIYYVLHTDILAFDAALPNTSGGCQGVHLTFAGGEIELDWDWQHAFRPLPGDMESSAIAYHLVVRSASERQACVRVPTEDDCTGLGAIDAAAALPWNVVAGEPLNSVTMWGVPLQDDRVSPQAVALHFPSGDVVVTIGITNPQSLGDGDEVLVFAGAEWAQKMAEQPQGWLTPFWWSSVSHGNVVR